MWKKLLKAYYRASVKQALIDYSFEDFILVSKIGRTKKMFKPWWPKIIHYELLNDIFDKVNEQSLIISGNYSYYQFMDKMNDLQKATSISNVKIARCLSVIHLSIAKSELYESEKESLEKFLKCKFKDIDQINFFLGNYNSKYVKSQLLNV